MPRLSPGLFTWGFFFAFWKDAWWYGRSCEPLISLFKKLHINRIRERGLRFPGSLFLHLISMHALSTAERVGLVGR